MKVSPHARAIRDVEDEELRGFFHGMSAWQVKFNSFCEAFEALKKLVPLRQPFCFF